MSSLYQQYKETVVPKLKAELGYANSLQVPRVTKVVLNAGIGRFVKDAGYIDNVEKTFLKITGQKPIRTKAKQSISNFKIRAGMEIGVAVTLRGPRMYDFLERLLRVTFPRVRDFHGISPAGFDAQGNYTIGFKENTAFPEIKLEEIDKVHGLQVIVATNAKTREEGMKLLALMGFPFTKDKKAN